MIGPPSALASAWQTAERVVLMAVMLAFASWIVWNAVKVWRGDEVRAIAVHERSTGPWPGAWGSRRRYRSFLGAGFLGLPIGLGFGVIAATDLLRMALGRDEDWGPWWAASYAGVVLLLVGVAGVIAYRTVGLPDRLRPPCQRGWEVVDGELVLVRPGVTVAERRERRPLGVGPSPVARPAPPPPHWPDPSPEDRR